MARLPRVHLAGCPEHIIQRGNNRQVCFASEEDFAAYAHWLKGIQMLLVCTCMPGCL